MLSGKKGKRGLVVQACHPCWLRKEDDKFKVILNNMARYCLKEIEVEASWQSTCLALHAQEKAMFSLQH